MALDLARLRDVCRAKTDNLTRNTRNAVTSEPRDVTGYVTPPTPQVTPFGSDIIGGEAHVTLRTSVTPQTPYITPVTCVTSQKSSLGFGVQVDPDEVAEPDVETPVTDPEFWQRVADERNANSALAGRTDRYCSCQRTATVAVGKGRASPTNPEGVGRWLCEKCFGAGAPFPIPSPRKSSPGVAVAPPVDLTIVPRPDEPARADWWSAPVPGWTEGKLTISQMIGDETYEIDFRERGEA